METANQIIDLVESKSKVITCDVQPGYSSFIRFDIYELMEYLNNSAKVLVFYVGQDFGFESEQDIRYWYYDHGLDESINLTFIEKNYAFFRAWMDSGADDELIKRVVKFMHKKRINDSRDLKQIEIDKLIGDEWDDWMENDPLIVPDIDLNIVKKFNSAELVGGAEQECLAELRLYLDAFKINYKVKNKFVY
jgi:hypothetical protein